MAAFRALRSARTADKEAPKEAFSACSPPTLACRAVALAWAEARAASREAAFLDALRVSHHTWVVRKSALCKVQEHQPGLQQ